MIGENGMLMFDEVKGTRRPAIPVQEVTMAQNSYSKMRPYEAEKKLALAHIW